MHDILPAHGHAAGGEDQIGLVSRLPQHRSNALRIIRLARQHMRLCAKLCQPCGEHGAIRIVDSAKGQRLAGLHELVSCAQQADAHTAHHAHLCHAHAGEHAKVRRRQPLTSVHHHGARMHVLACPADIPVMRYTGIDADPAHALVGILLAHHAVAAVGNRRARHHAQRLPRADEKALAAARAGLAHHLEHGGMLPGRPGDILAAQAVAIQRGAVKRRHRHGRGDVLRRHAAQRLAKGHKLRLPHSPGAGKQQLQCPLKRLHGSFSSHLPKPQLG